MKTDTKIVVENGKPSVFHSGEKISQNVYCDYILNDNKAENDNWCQRVSEFVDSGATVFHIRVPYGSKVGSADYYDGPFWLGDNVFSVKEDELEWSLDYQASVILERCPTATIYIKFLLAPPKIFADKNPGEMQTDEDGKIYRQPTLSAPKYRKQLRIYLETLLTYCEGRSWSDNIIGYLGMPIGEGITPLTINGKMFDVSASNEKNFTAWAKKKHKTLSAIRKAWGDDTLTLKSAFIPRDKEWLAKRDSLVPSIEGKTYDPSSITTNCGAPDIGAFHWVEEADAAQVRDYCRFMRDSYIDWMADIHHVADEIFEKIGNKKLFGLDSLKQPQIGWQIQSSFDGIGDGQSFPSLFVFTGCWGIESLLNDSTLNVVWNPADYYARSLGFAYESEGLTDSMALRGKVAIVENDCRTYVGKGIEDQGAFRNIQEVKAGLLRNAALPFSRGLHSYWCNVGSSYFHDTKIQEFIRTLVPMQDRLQSNPHRETSDAIAFVIDDESLLYEDFTSGYQTLALIIQRIRGLSHCGVPYRIFLLSDLKQKNIPAYKTWLFPNLFNITPAVKKLLTQKVLHSGNVAIFGPATGITDGTYLNAKGATDILGVEMECLPRTSVRHVIVQDGGHPITSELPANEIFGDSMGYGPTLLPKYEAVEAAGGHALGHANTIWFQNRPGLFVKDFGKGARGSKIKGDRGKKDYSVVFSVALPLPANLLRSCARYAGSHIWCESDDVIYASDSMVCIHTSKQGAREIALPRTCKVVDAVTGKQVGTKKIKKISVKLKSPDTRIFILEK